MDLCFQATGGNLRFYWWASVQTVCVVTGGAGSLCMSKRISTCQSKMSIDQDVMILGGSERKQT